MTVERDKLREKLAAAHGTIDAFQTASGLCVPAEEQGGDPGGVQPRHVEEHIHALAKRVEALETLLAEWHEEGCCTPSDEMFAEARYIAERRASPSDSKESE